MARPPIPGPEPVISVSADGDVVVLRPRGDLDRSTTETLVGLVGAATSCGAVAAIVFGPDVAAATSPLPPADTVEDTDTDTDKDTDTGTGTDTDTVDTVGPGRVRLRSAHSHWTFDLLAARMFVSDGPVDWRFVGPGAWTPIRGLWASRSRVAVLTPGGVVSIATGWRSPRRPQPAPERGGCVRWHTPAA